MSHRTYRHIDTPVPYLGLSWRQWVVIVCCAAFALGVIDLLHPPTPVALWLGTVLIAGPATFGYLTNGSGSVGRLLCDHARWMLAPRELPAASETRNLRVRGFLLAATADHPRVRLRRSHRRIGSPSSGDLLPLRALCQEGVGVLSSGAFVRWIEVSTPVNPLIYDSEETEAIAQVLQQLASRLDERQSLQLLAHATPLPVQAIIQEERHTCQQAVTNARTEGKGGLALACERLGLAQEQSIRTQSDALAAMQVRYLVVVPWLPARTRLLTRLDARRGPLRMTPHAYQRACHESARRTEGVRSDLQAAGLSARELDGQEVAGLLRERFDSAQSENPLQDQGALELPATLAQLDSPKRAQAHTRGLWRALCPQPVNLRDRRVIRIGKEVAQTRYLGSLPEQTWLGWLLHLMSASCPFTVSVHIHGTDRARERQHHRRRYKRIFGNNRGTELKGRPLDPDQGAQEQEAADLNGELALTGAGVYGLSCYLTIPEPCGDTEILQDTLDGIARELSAVNDAQLHTGLAAQSQSYTSTLPLGLDTARRTRKYVSVNVGDTTPLVGVRCGSPSGIPIGYSTVGRSLVRLDLFDPAHNSHMLLVTGDTGHGKTMLVNNIYARALARGDHGAVIERGGHYEFLASLIPGAANIRLGAGADAICPWDTPNPACVPPEKVDYLIALHAVLIGSGRRGEYGLTALEENLLGRAIRRAYERCALTGETPRELLLHETIRTWTASEHQGGLADALADIAARLHNFIGGGPYAYLADWPTTIPGDSPFVVFDTASIPDRFAGAAMFEIVEHTAERVARNLELHLTQNPQDVPGIAGRHTPRLLLTLEEVWRLLENDATARWVNELPRRGRHENLAFIGVSHLISDFTSPTGRAFFDATTRKITFHQSPRQIRLLQEELGITSEEVRAVAALRTVWRDYATAYFDNGPRGRGTIIARFSDLEYWTATHNPEHDEPLRRQALREAHGDPWRALRLLADPDWHQQLKETQAL